MPTVLRFSGLRVVVYPNDHQPAHVHVIGGGCEPVFDLNGPGGLPRLRENYGFTQRQLVMVLAELSNNLKSLCAAWRVIREAD